MFDVEAALHAGVGMIQYRNKDSSTLAMYEEVLAIRKLCTRGLFIVNDRLDIALAAGADGVHIGQDDMPYEAARRILGKKRIIGVTVHTLKEALAAEASGADYVGVSPVFSTGTKQDAGVPVGIALVREISSGIKIPVVAIGGISLSNAAATIRAGADAICSISAVVASDDPESEINKFQEMFT
jgi:thiamine-phosphate pyrophosphorylase